MPNRLTAPLKIVVAGHVDHGKSTLIGRLLHDTGSLPTGKLEELQAVSAKRGMALEWSFALDSFQAERNQAITIDTTQIRFKTHQRQVVIIDAPGHREFLKNMISGATNADAALLVVDGIEGVREQTRRHAYLLHLIGLRQLAVVINKLDMVGYSEARFSEISKEIITYLGELGMKPEAVIPISARHGDNLANRSDHMPWYQGPTVLDMLDRLPAAAPPVAQALRLPIQDVYKFDERRILVGRIETGSLKVGETLLFSPSGRTARVRTIEAWNQPIPQKTAKAGDSIGITLDEQVFVERGDIASLVEAPPLRTDTFRATIFWLAHQPLREGADFTLKLGTAVTGATVQTIERVVDTETLDGRTVAEVGVNEVAEIILRTHRPLALDAAADHPATGRLVLVDGFQVVAGGLVSSQLPGTEAVSVLAENETVSPAIRARRNRHRGAVVWFTGLSGAGKSTLSAAVERKLFQQGRQVYVLDGDVLRKGINADLGFSPEDRAENIRRVGEVAALFADAGIIVLVALISPYRADRALARAAARGAFHEIHVAADLAACEQRDPKGLYARARRGEIADFTGVTAPYEPPEKPELVIDTASQPLADSVQSMLAYLDRHVVQAVEDFEAGASGI
ncbi:Sulfate adenylyltransferase subunit 1 / Adenylyl-sulfate kinase [uncultured Gammaproteobacteria bacterium]